MRRAIVVALTLAISLVLGVVGVGTAGADVGVQTVDTTTGALTKDQVKYYTAKRIVSVSGSDIYVRKTDGPGIKVMWYKCGHPDVHGNWRRLVNDDPTPYVRIGTNFEKNTSFCLAAWDDQGKNAKDTWTGQVKYNVF